MLIGELPVRCARRYPNKDATVFGGERRSFRAFNERVNRAANALVAMSLKKGEKVAVLSRNRPEMLEVMFAQDPEEGTARGVRAGTHCRSEHMTGRVSP